MSRDLTIPSLTIAELGKVLTQGLMLYRADWRTYAKLSAQAYAWLWVPIYGWNRYLILSGVISRLGFSILNGEGKTLAQSVADLKRCRFKLFWLSLRVGWRMLLMSILFTTLLALSVVLLASLQGWDFAHPLLGPGLATVICIFLIWPYSKLFLAEMPLVTSPRQSIKKSIQVSQVMSQGCRWEILGLILTTTLVLTPISILISEVLPSLLLGLRKGHEAVLQVSYLANSLSSPLASSSPLVVAVRISLDIVYILTESQSWQSTMNILLFMVCTIAAAIAILPLWQLVKSALYYKILCNHEGVDLKLPTRS